jgi:MOSC domain-containing protein YiiM
MGSDTGIIVSINVSRGGVPKLPVLSARVSPAGIAGDAQRDLRHHGGPDRAVCLFSLERIEALQRDGHDIAPGTTGENLTVAGLDWEAVVPGAVLRAGEVAMEITSYASPCTSIRSSFVDDNSNHISQKLHPGWSRVYARVTRAGLLAVGDTVTLQRPVPAG